MWRSIAEVFAAVLFAIIFLSAGIEIGWQDRVKYERDQCITYNRCFEVGP